jgi:hypothetical protein
MRAKALELQNLGTKVLHRCTVAEIRDSGEILVRLDPEPSRLILCEFLETSENDRPDLREGDRVLVLISEDPEDKACVLGRIGTYRKPNRKQIVLDAEEEVSIRCGSGSITIRKSGKILVKGMEIVSHAKGAHRIRGGSIQLN